MRLFIYLLFIFIVAGSLLIAITLYLHVMETMKRSVEGTLGHITSQYVIPVNTTDYDMTRPLTPYLLMVSFILIIGFIVAVVATAIYTRRR